MYKNRFSQNRQELGPGLFGMIAYVLWSWNEISLLVHQNFKNLI